jgi:hypothetical protein
MPAGDKPDHGAGLGSCNTEIKISSPWPALVCHFKEWRMRERPDLDGIGRVEELA